MKSEKDADEELIQKTIMGIIVRNRNIIFKRETSYNRISLYFSCPPHQSIQSSTYLFIYFAICSSINQLLIYTPMSYISISVARRKANKGRWRIRLKRRAERSTSRNLINLKINIGLFPNQNSFLKWERYLFILLPVDTSANLTIDLLVSLLLLHFSFHAYDRQSYY